MTGEYTDVDKVLASESGIAQNSRGIDARTAKYRPTARPPMGVLDVFDDGQRDAERFRIRQDVTTVGRAGCDICIPHDGQISALHFKIVLEAIENRWRWSLIAEEKSAIFVRVKRTRLRHRSEFLAGNQRFQYRAGVSASSSSKDDLVQRLSRGSIPGESVDASLNCDSVVHLSANSKQRPLWLLGSEFWIGRAPECALSIADDQFLALHHVRLVKQANGEWQAMTNKVPNGLWIKVKSIHVQSICTFQVGEQRMRFAIC